MFTQKGRFLVFLLLIITLIIWTTGCFSYELRDTFEGKELNNKLWQLSEYAPGIFSQGDGARFKTDRKYDAYKWASIGSTYSVSGDFDVSVDWQCNVLDHWNEIRFSTGKDNNYIQIMRKQKEVGNHIYSIEVSVDGNKVVKQEVPTKAYKGSFKIVRKSRVIKGYVKEDGEWKEIGSYSGFPDKSVGISLGIGSPAFTMIDAVFKNFLLKTEQEIEFPAFVYGRRGILCDMKDIGGVYLLYVEKGQIQKDNTVEIMPGGRAVYGVEGPLNGGGFWLEWRSTGPIKLSGVQIGTSETIELSETLLWDETTRETVLERRSVSLYDFITRFSGRRNWNIPYCTSNNIFFFTFRPSLEQKVTVSSVALGGTPLVIGEIPEPESSISDLEIVKKEISGKDYLMLKWDVSYKGGETWWGTKNLPKGKEVLLRKEILLKEIPFIISPTVLNKQFDSLRIPVETKAGVIHLAHTSGAGVPGNEYHVATYIIKYEDGCAEPIFTSLNWNCGVYDSNWRARGMADYTWWGPPSFPWAAAHYIGEGVSWNAVYVASYINPHPEKKIKEIIVTLPPHKSTFALLGITFEKPEICSVGLIEPLLGGYVLYEKPNILDVMVWRPVEARSDKRCSLYVSKMDEELKMTDVSLIEKGNFAFATFSFKPEDYKVLPGPVKFICRDKNGFILARSSLLGWMPSDYSEENKKFYLTMIGGGAESRAEFERIRRLGYDVMKGQMWWKTDEPEEGKFDFTGWEGRLNLIKEEGLKFSLRNLIIGKRSIPSYLQEKVGCKIRSDTGESTDSIDTTDPVYISALSRYYGEVGKFLSKFPHIVSINANYGTNSTTASNGVLYLGNHQMEILKDYLKKNYSLKDFQEKTGLNNYDEITANTILDDKSGFLLKNLIRATDEVQKKLIRKVVESIRNSGYKGHLTFNVAYHHINNRLWGAPFDEYLRMGLEYPPASPYHETSDRYCLSFFKWLAAKRTLNLPYGDEGNQNPPTYEHNILAYQWMMMFQCWDAEYCQWYFGRPGSQNIVWLKPFYHMIFNSEYIADPVSLALSFESGFEEVPNTARVSNPHSPIMSHYGLANTLRAININTDNYIMDYFPQTDKKVNRLVIDDISRFVSDGFAARLEKFIKSGGVFVATGETDILQEHKFLKKFGIELEGISDSTRIMINKNPVSVPGGKWKILPGEGIEVIAYWETGDIAIASKKIDSGKIVVFGKNWDQWAYDHNLPDSYILFVRDILCNLGNFAPAVKSDVINVSCTPYKAKDGSILVHIFNIFARPIGINLYLRKDLLPDAKYAIDLGSMVGFPSNTNIVDTGDYWKVSVREIPPIHSTVIKFVSEKKCGVMSRVTEKE